MVTRFPSGQEIARKWYLVDATGQTLGRLASRVARILSGKENPRYTPFLDTGDHVIVINAEKIRVTGMRAEQKVYRHYTGHPVDCARKSSGSALSAGHSKWCKRRFWACCRRPSSDAPWARS